MPRRPSSAALFPYTTLFRSDALGRRRRDIGPQLLGGDGGCGRGLGHRGRRRRGAADRKSTRLNSSHRCISYAVFCLKKKKKTSAIANSSTGHRHAKKAHTGK